jgi:hypothetical protein
MKLKHVQFVNVVQFGGSLQSLSVQPVGDQPGQTENEIEFDEKMRFVRLARRVNGRHAVKFVPVANVASFEPAEEEVKVEPVRPVVKK